MTNEAYIRASKIQTEISNLDKAIAFIEKMCMDGCSTLRLDPFGDFSWHRIDLFVFSSEDNKRIMNRILTALKDERDLLKTEYEEL